MTSSMFGTLFAILFSMNQNNMQTVPAGSILPSVAPLAMTCPSGFEAYLAILGVSKSALKAPKLPKF